ncbi:MAG: Coenzyme F420 hydrogenase/dehydrogenase, beta subunit C-terminal domain [Candidatus Hydrothermarchaeaceae archaeon]
MMAIDTESFVPLMEKSLGFEGLKRDVVDQDLCSGCGACGSFCDRIEVDEDGAKLVKDCTLELGSIKCGDDGTCYDNCPMVSHSRAELDEASFGKTREDPVLGVYEKIVAVKAKDKAIQKAGQDGGAVTALLQCAVDTGMVVGAGVAPRDDEWKPEPEIASKKDDLKKSAGTKYARATTPIAFGKSFSDQRRLAVVGTGCQIEGMRRIHENLLKDAFEKTRESDKPLDSLLIGLFCYENFPYTKIREKLESEPFNVDLKNVAKTDIIKGKIIVTLKKGKEIVHPVKMFNDIVPDCCNLCDDFAATFADISVGSVGSKDGWSTVMVRSKKGLELLETAEKKGYVQVSKEASAEVVKKTSDSKNKKREAVRERRQGGGALIPTYA